MDPNIKKSILIVAPHTSWHDFYIGVLVRKIINLDMHFVGKKELFDSFLGGYFKWMGGAPVDRSKSLKMVDQIVAIFNSRTEFRLAIAPEGTRKKVKQWKTGFYYIAEKAKVPIIPIVFNYKLKQVEIKKPFRVNGNILQELPILKSNFDGIIGKIPENS
ncbi:acyltransferase [Psychroflexus salis]|uniref:Acyltransferase n=2 Tax=Psychroflexus salis TaxID=1526574 RepID=A0A916ZQK1_9FLAO|nr:acyltransferase [Psychroflexus salis]